MDTPVLLLGRVLFGGYSVFSAFNHVSNLPMMAGYAQSKGVPAEKAAVIGGGVLLAIGGISVIFNILPLVGLSALILFLAPVTDLMHPFWKVQDPMAKVGEMVNFTKNLALLGAVVMFLASVIS